MAHKWTQTLTRLPDTPLATAVNLEKTEWPEMQVRDL